MHLDATHLMPGHGAIGTLIAEASARTHAQAMHRRRRPGYFAPRALAIGFLVVGLLAPTLGNMLAAALAGVVLAVMFLLVLTMTMLLAVVLLVMVRRVLAVLTAALVTFMLMLLVAHGLALVVVKTFHRFGHSSAFPHNALAFFRGFELTFRNLLALGDVEIPMQRAGMLDGPGDPLLSHGGALQWLDGRPQRLPRSPGE